ncbi:MAG TPA: prepilin-type N-terminal cleavage/methylation domain-containing protein, partial [Polyangia bacterium]|nr:prepilin-type N-terminal cleavage/methylation domain-containing protein [Polyangia bacterium]
MTRDRARGFTLIEIMIAMALAGLVVAGALQLHASFNKQTERQSEVAEMQQNLRVSMLMIERAIRNAGYGIPGGMLPEMSNNPPSCSNLVKRFHYGFEWSNNNTYTDPMTIVTWAAKSATANDVDPDYFWVMSADTATVNPPLYALSDNGSGLTTMTTATTTASMVNFNVSDLFIIQFPSTSTNCTGGNCALLAVPAESAGDIGDTTAHCIREITAVSSGGTTKTLTHNLSSAKYCFNYVPTGGDTCAAGINTNTPTELRHLEPNVTAYRIMTPTDTYNTNGTPKLTYRYAPMNTPYNSSTYNWNVIAENIDDMQIAVISKSGVVCNQSNDPSYNAIDSNSCDIT